MAQKKKKGPLRPHKNWGAPFKKQTLFEILKMKTPQKKGV